MIFYRDIAFFEFSLYTSRTAPPHAALLWLVVSIPLLVEQRVDEIAFNMMIIIFLTSAISLTASGPFNYHRPSPFFGRPSYPVPVYFNKYFTIPYTSHLRIERKNQKYKDNLCNKLIEK